MFVEAFKFVVLLLFLVNNLLATAHSYTSCPNLLGIPLTKRCTGTISRSIRRNYADKYAAKDAPYALFSVDSLMLNVFITIYDSPVMRCDKLIVNNSNHFVCNEHQEISITFTKMVCYEYPMRYVGALRDNCMRTRNAAYHSIEQSILHYADCPSVAQSKIGNCWLLTITAIAYLFAN